MFSANASSPDQPTWSNDGSREEARAIGRKRHGYGMAMGGLVLPEGMTAAGVVRKTLTQALVENGYKVVESESLNFPSILDSSPAATPKTSFS